MQLFINKICLCDSLVFISIILTSWNCLVTHCESFVWNANLEDVELFDLSSIKLTDKAYQPKVKSISIKSKIRFRYARTRIVSTIMNPDPLKSHEVNFKLRLPKEAFISRFEMRVHGGLETYKANITTREEAAKILQFAKSENRTVTLGLVEQLNERFNEFSIKLIIGSQKTFVYMLIYEERLPRVLGKYENVIHLVPEQLSNKTAFRIEVLIEETEKITSVMVPTSDEEGQSYRHATIENLSEKYAKVTWTNKLETGETYCDYPQEDFVVVYSLEDEATTGHVLVRNGYFVHFFAPQNIQPLKKHVVFVLDISDSMVGTKMMQLKSAILEMLDELKFDDFFNIIAFSSTVKVWSFYNGNKSQYLFPFPANAKFKDSAQYFVNNLEPHGSTNIYAAITTALEICTNVSSSLQSLNKKILTGSPRFRPISKYEEYLPDILPKDVQSIILLFTDGTPTSGHINKKVILHNVEKLNRKLSVPIFSLAFGESADFPFLTKLSQRNNAFARKVFENADATLQLADFYREISSPTLANLSFTYSSSTSEITNSQDMTNSGHSMIFRGTEILIVGKLNQEAISNSTDGEMVKARVYGNGRFGRVFYDIPVKQCGGTGSGQEGSSCPDEIEIDDKCLEKLYVYLTIKNLLKEQAGFEVGQRLCWPSNPEDVYWHDDLETEQFYDNCTLTLKERAVELALKYGLVTPYTSLVMRTISILEEEMETASDPRLENSDWEWFLGNVNPLPDNSKLLDGRNQDHDEEDGIQVYELPMAQALTSHKSIELKDSKNLESYSIFHLGDNTTQLADSFRKPDSSLTLENVTWLKDMLMENLTVVEIPNLKGRPILYNIALEPPRHNNSEVAVKSCTSPETQCKHFIQCLLPEFINDFNSYLTSYWCPIRYEGYLYLGVCCPY